MGSIKRYSKVSSRVWTVDCYEYRINVLMSLGDMGPNMFLYYGKFEAFVTPPGAATVPLRRIITTTTISSANSSWQL